MRLTNVQSAKRDASGIGSSTLAVLHEDGWVSFWVQSTWQFAYAFKLNTPAKRIIFECSDRYLASLTEAGQVEVWKLKGVDAKYQWGLQFNSVTNIVANATIEN